MKKFGIGIEIECIYNNNIISIDKGCYHEGIENDRLPLWKAEVDSSISNGGEFDGWEDECEFVSVVLRSKKQFKQALNNFYSFFSHNKRFELSEVLSFNDTCGSHVHFSIDGLRFDDKVIFEIFEKIRLYFLKKLRNSNIESKQDIKKHYNRDYAKLIDKENWKYGRRLEFNFESETTYNKGLEWRSLNLLNIKTWKEFNEFWDIVWDCLEYFYKKSQKYEIKFEENLIDKEGKRELRELIKKKKEKILLKKQRKRTYSRYGIKIRNFEDGEIKCVI